MSHHAIGVRLAILNFLCIHPFLAGIGRMARLLTLQLLYHFDYAVGRFISQECIFEASKKTRCTSGDSVKSRASAVVGLQVDLNPHQVEAALITCANPLPRGVILAVKVGLGKTIEAGLVISQRIGKLS